MRRIPKVQWCSLFLLQAVSLWGGEKRVIAFPGYGVLAPDGRQWVAGAGAWVFDPETDSVRRKLFVKALGKFLAVSEADAASPLFNERARLFLVDNKSGRVVDLSCQGHVFSLGTTAGDGQVEGDIRLPARDLAPGGMIPFQVYPARHPESAAPGALPLIGPAGTSVVSDIDDTIKISSVTRHSDLVANTFFREWRAVPGMAEVFSAWEKQGAVFHYLSASPRQLFPSLQAFVKEAGFPGGVFHLRRFQWTELFTPAPFSPPPNYKTAILESLLADFPKRRFIFVGDSGERDPEIYAQFARMHPGRVAAIFIRSIPDRPLTAERRRSVFAGLPPDLARVFTDPNEILPRGPS